MQLTTIARKVLKAVAMAAVALAMTWCGSVAFTTSRVPRAHAADANYQLIQEPDAGYSAIIGLISGAARSVHITMYELTDPAAVDALIDAHRRGVEPRSFSTRHSTAATPTPRPSKNSATPAST